MRGPTVDLDGVRGCKYLKRTLVQGEAILRVGDAERLAQTPWTGAQEPFVGNAATPAHGGKPVRRRECADQHRAGLALRLAYEVEAPVNTVGAVDIGITRRAEHDGIALGAAAEGMRRGIGVVIGLDLDDDAAHPLEQKRRADEIGGDGVHAADKEVSAERFEPCHLRLAYDGLDPGRCEALA